MQKILIILIILRSFWNFISISTHLPFYRNLHIYTFTAYSFSLPFCCTPEISRGMFERIVISLVTQRSGWFHWPSITVLSVGVRRVADWWTWSVGYQDKMLGWHATFSKARVNGCPTFYRTKTSTIPSSSGLTLGYISFLKRVSWLTNGQEKSWIKHGARAPVMGKIFALWSNFKSLVIWLSNIIVTCNISIKPHWFTHC